MVVDRRGFGVIGAIFAMVIAGLIVYAVVNYGPSIWHGIQGGSGTTPDGGGDGGSVLSADAVMQHPEEYLGKTITVEGWYVAWGWVGSVMATYNAISPVDPSQLQAGTAVGGLPVDVPENITVFSGMPLALANST